MVTDVHGRGRVTAVEPLQAERSSAGIVIIVGLARDFGYETIAEGVEDAETLALVKEFGVNFAQGFYLGRPAPIDSSLDSETRDGTVSSRVHLQLS